MTFWRRKRDGHENLWPDATESTFDVASDAKAIGDAAARVPVRIAGRVKAVRVQPLAGVPTLRATLADDTGQLVLVFLGRRHVAGVEPGRRMLCEGVIVEQNGRPHMLNPVYRLL